MRHNCLGKKRILASITFLLFSLAALSQGGFKFKYADPNNSWRIDGGDIITADSAESLISRRLVQWKPKLLSDSKVEYILTRETIDGKWRKY